MNHLNIFHPYKNKPHHHEDELTRSFLILLKNIPVVQMMFFEMVQQEMKDTEAESITLRNLSIEEMYTQKSSEDRSFLSKIEGRKLVSIIISDDKLETDATVKNDDRLARYDGVVLCNSNSDSWVFIIENKPSKENIWLRQLNPNVREEQEINIISKPCCLSWRDIIASLNSLIQNRMFYGFELQAVEDFLEYVDETFPQLNPYTSFEVCKGNIDLLNKRCRAIMANCEINGEKREVKYHRGWKYYIESGVNTVKQIALDANESKNGFTIDLWLHAGDTMSSARETYSKLNKDKLLKLEEKGFELSNNFHVSYRSRNLLWLKNSPLTFEKYIDFWLTQYREKKIKQIKRKDFNNYFKFL